MRAPRPFKLGIALCLGGVLLGTACSTSPPGPSPSQTPEATPTAASPSPMAGTSECREPGATGIGTGEPVAWTPDQAREDWPAAVRPEPSGEPILVMPEPGEVTQVHPLYLPVVIDAAGDLVPAAPGWLDLTEVRVQWVVMDDPIASTVIFELAGEAPIPFPDPEDQWVAYGLVIDVDGDGCGDLRLGMDNAPGGEHRAWVTDLATGVTQAKTGPSYGYAGDFFWDTYLPGESDHLDSDSGQGLLSHQSVGLFRFYVWASLIEDGQVVATDYGPDHGWIDPGEGAPLQ